MKFKKKKIKHCNLLAKINCTNKRTPDYYVKFALTIKKKKHFFFFCTKFNLIPLGKTSLKKNN